MKKTFLAFLFLFTCVQFSNAQLTAGLYKTNHFTYVGIGTNPEQKFFGEARVFAGDITYRYFGIEGIAQYNFVTTDWYNFSGGIMAGYHEFDEGRVGFPFLLSIKPIQAHKNLALVMEATPLFTGAVHFRGNLGIRYFFKRIE